MSAKGTLFFILLILISGLLLVFASVTSTTTYTAVSPGYPAGVWIKHPGIAVGKVLGPAGPMVTVVADTGGMLHAFRGDTGAELSGFPKNLLNHPSGPPGGVFRADQNDLVNSTAALVDINGDGKLEIFIGSGDGYVYGFDSLGNTLPGWPQSTGAAAGDGNYGVFSSPCVADLDGDGVYEVIVGAFSHLIYVWNANTGAPKSGWPFDNTDTVWSSPAVADLNGDGKLEIVIGGDSTTPPGGVLRVFRYTGEQLSGWPQFIDQIIQSSPAIGDIDGDGQLEIVVGTGLFYAGTGQYVNAYRANGTKVAGWPVSLTGHYTRSGCSGSPPAPDNRVFGSPALADLDGNGKLETFVGDNDGYLWCINPNGTIRWFNTPGQAGPCDSYFYSLFSSPAVGDVDGDGIMEVVTGGGFHMAVFNALTGAKKYQIYTGSAVPPFSSPPEYSNAPLFTWGSPTIADVDGDGKIDLLIGTGRKNYTPVSPDNAPSNVGLVRVYHEAGSAAVTGPGDSLGSTGVSRAKVPWPRFRKNDAATGSPFDPTLPSTPKSNLISGASAAPFVISPNGDGINDTVSISFSLSSPDFLTLDILDRTGVIVATPLNHVSEAAGTHIVTWDGTTLSGPTAIDGMYTFQIQGDLAARVTGTFGISNTIPEVNKSWFLAEGSTVGFQAYVLIQNPNPTPITANVTFIRQDGTTKLYTETVTARTRTTVPIHDPIIGSPNTYSVSTRVDADQPIIVERAMYFNFSGTYPGGQGGHDTIGVTRTGTSWYLTGNRSFAGDEDFILMVNPSPTTSASVTATYLFDTLAPIVQNYTIAPSSRFTVALHDPAAFPTGVRLSASLRSSIPIAAERALYINSRAGGVGGIGAASTSLSWYFAEGNTTADTTPVPIAASDFLEMMNPGTLPTKVTVNYMIEDGTVLSKVYDIKAQGRLTLDCANELGALNGPAGKRFSMEVLSNNPIAAERLMFSGSDLDGTIGSPTTAYIWNLAEGFTAFGYETWVIVSNPGTQTANITARFLQQNGTNILQNYSLPPKTRQTIYVNQVPGVQATSVSTQVTSDQPIVVERTMKFAGRYGMHQAMGVRQ
ncbi:MAG TPA: FG-GAP-like repeat-containing protein [Acidobacteriota bacterium]|jgi:hypothetical protein